MRKTKGLIISLAAAIIGLSAVSCAKEDSTLRYDNATMGNIVNGVFTSDQGNIFNVTDQVCAGKLDTMKRAFIICDVLGSTDGAEKEFDVRLTHISNVLVKDAVSKVGIEDMERYKNDPLILQDLWISGGYINLYVIFPVKPADKKAHEINLLHELKDGVYEFQISHDAQGEILKTDGDNSDLKLVYAYASFPVNTIIEEDTAKMAVKWNSYIYNGGLVHAQTREITIEREYKKSQFEQVPPTAIASTVSYGIE